MKITLITACYNSVATIGDAVESVRRQKLEKAGGESRSTADGQLSLEYIVVDGGSTDGTVELIRKFELGIRNEGRVGFSFKWISERDKGLYDALNKGIQMATGDVIGICNADDVLASDDVVARVAGEFLTQGHRGTELDVVYADVRFVKGEPSCVADPKKNLRASVSQCLCVNKNPSHLDLLRSAPTTRYCTGRFFRRWMFRFATFPAHPSTFVRREWFAKAGWYSLDYRICADFEFMLRLFCKCRVRAKYLPLCTHVMRSGGMSTDGVHSNVQINREDLRALRANGYWACLPMLYVKYPFKIFGILFRNFYAR